MENELTKAQLDELEHLAQVEPTSYVRVRPAALLELIKVYRHVKKLGEALHARRQK